MKSPSEMLKPILFSILLLNTSHAFAVEMVYVFEGQVANVYRENNLCQQPCDSGQPLDPNSSTYEQDSRIQTNASFQMIFTVDWTGDPDYNQWDSTFSSSRLQVFDADSTVDTHVSIYDDPSKNVVTNVDHGDAFSTMLTDEQYQVGPNASWDQYSSSGRFQTIGVDNGPYTSYANWFFALDDKSITDPGVPVDHEAVSISTYDSNTLFYDSYIYDFTNYDLSRSIFRLDGLSDVTLTSYFGNAMPNMVSTVPVPATVWLFGSGLLSLIGVARRKKAA